VRDQWVKKYCLFSVVTILVFTASKRADDASLTQLSINSERFIVFPFNDFDYCVERLLSIASRSAVIANNALMFLLNRIFLTLATSLQT